MEEFFLRRFLAGDELDVIDHQQIGRAKLLLEAERLVGAKRGEEFDRELLGRHVDDLRTRIEPVEFVTDGVQQVGLAAPGAAMDEQRVERDLLGRGERAGRIEGDLVRLADDEIAEHVARLERDGIKAVVSGRRRRRGRRRNLDLGGGARRGGADPDDDPPHLGQRGAPGQCEPLGEMGLHPIGHELRRQFEPEHAGLRIEAAKRDRPQPAVEGARAAIAPEPGANRLPRRDDRIGVRVRHRQSRIQGRRHHVTCPPLSLAAPGTAIFLAQSDPCGESALARRVMVMLCCLRPAGRFAPPERLF